MSQETKHNSVVHMKVDRLQVNDRLQVHATTVVMRDSDTTRIQFSVGKWIGNVVLLIKKRENEPSGFTVKSEQDHAVIELVNWDNPVSTATASPVPFATFNTGQKLFFMIWHSLAGDLHKIDISFWLEKQE